MDQGLTLSELSFKEAKTNYETTIRDIRSAGCIAQFESFSFFRD